MNIKDFESALKSLEEIVLDAHDASR